MRAEKHYRSCRLYHQSPVARTDAQGCWVSMHLKQQQHLGPTWKNLKMTGYLLSNNSNIWTRPGRTWRWLGTYFQTTATSGPYLEELGRWLGIYESQTTAGAGPYLKELEDDAPIGSHHFQQHVKLRAVGSLTVGCTQRECQEIQHGWYDQSTRFMNLGEINGKCTRSVLICLSVIWIYTVTHNPPHLQTN